MGFSPKNIIKAKSFAHECLKVDQIGLWDFVFLGLLCGVAPSALVILISAFGNCSDVVVPCPVTTARPYQSC